MTDFLLTNVEHGLTGLLGDDARFRGGLRVKGGVIAEIGGLAPLPGERVIDAGGCVVCPGLVNTHHHLFQSVMKAVPSALDEGLDAWLMEVPYRLWPALDAEALRVSATVGLAELALSGATTVADMHYVYSPRHDYDPSEVLVQTAAAFGMRFVLGRGGMTRGRPSQRADIPQAPTETLDGMLRGIEAAAKRWHDPSPFAATRVAAAPTTTVFNLRDGEPRDMARAVRAMGLRLHTHLSENGAYGASTLERFGKRPVHWMAEEEWVGSDVWFAHLVACEADELAVLAQTGTAMAHCPQANARLGSGIAPAPELARRGGIVSLAVDGAGANEGADMAQALYAAFTLHRAVGGASATKAETVLHWATAGGARALGLDGIGTLQPGKAADLVLIDLDHPRYFGQHDAALGPIVSGGAFRVKRSFVGGRELVVDGRVPWLDMEQLRADAARTVARIRSA